MTDSCFHTRKKALLVYPEVPKNTYWSFEYALRFAGKKSAMPPLGLLTVAALFPDHYDLKLVDLNIESLSEADVLWADAVFVSAMIVQKKSFQRCVDLCNRLGTPVVAGGPYPTAAYGDIRGVDHFVLGEVETRFGGFLDDFENGCAKAVYPASDKPDMGHSRVPRFDLINMSAYRTMSVQYSRGCPFNCEFCDIWRVYGNRPRLKPEASLLAELDALYELGWRGPVFIVDDNFIGNKKRAKERLLPLLRAWQEAHGFPYRFLTEASINLASDQALVRSLQAAGFTEVFIGIETPSSEALKETGKTHNLRFDMQAAVNSIQRCGIEVMAGFIVGFDSDDDDIAERQIDFIQQSGIPQAMVGLLTALPGTKLWERLQREGRLLRESDGNNTHVDAMNFRPKQDPARVKASYNRILATVYDGNLKHYFKRCSRLLAMLGTAPMHKRRIKANELGILVKSLLHQSFTPYGVQYLKYLARSLFQKGPIFAEAVRLAVVGHHFFMITQEMLKVENTSSLLEKRFHAWRMRLSEYRQTLSSGYGEKRQVMTELLRQKRAILRESRHRIQQIHIDFREEITLKYQQTAQHMQALMVAVEDRR